MIDDSVTACGKVLADIFKIQSRDVRIGNYADLLKIREQPGYIRRKRFVVTFNDYIVTSGILMRNI